MKNRLLTLALSLTSLSTLFAADLIVQEGGTGSIYTSISSAITASVNGDRIIIHPKVGGNSWIENLTIDKTLELVSSQDMVMYKIQGGINITGQNGRVVTIIGAHLVSGDIKGITSGWKTTANILGCQLDGGDIQFNNNFDVTIASNVLVNGQIYAATGSIIGNDISERIYIYNPLSTTDTINIIANKMDRLLSASTGVVNLTNNFIYNTVTQNNFRSIHITANPISFKIVNNTIGTPRSVSSSFGYRCNFIYENLPGNVYNNNFLIENNIFLCTTGSTNLPRIDASLFSSSVASNYNYYYRSYNAETITNSSSEITLTSNPINSTGILVPLTAAIDGANPSFQFYDLDLTVGDAGCYGGSYSLDNYFPITGSSRVFNIDMPFGISSGSTLNIKAIGFDR